MNKLLIAAGAVIAGLLVAGPSTAQAGHKGPAFTAEFHFGGHRDTYRPRYRNHYRPYDRPWVRHVMPRRQVIRHMRRQGYNHCRGWQVRRGVYALRCERRGRLFALRVNGWNGHIIARHRIG